MNKKKDIENKQDITLLVTDFYNKAKKDPLLASVFAKRIFDDAQWKTHLVKMSDFWQTVLFATPSYRGNPFSKHTNLDICPHHFEKWTQLFTNTIDENFEGEKSEEAKMKVRKMRTLFESKLAMIEQAGAISIV